MAPESCFWHFEPSVILLFRFWMIVTKKNIFEALALEALAF